MLWPLWSSTLKDLQIHNHKPSRVLATGAPDRFLKCEKVHGAGCKSLYATWNLHASSAHKLQTKTLYIGNKPEVTSLAFVQRSSPQFSSLGSTSDGMSETSIPLPYIIHRCEINLALISDSLDVFQ